MPLPESPSKRDYNGDALRAFFALGWRRASTEHTTTFGRVAILALILFIFWALWNATPLGELGTGHLTVTQLFWYLAATETVAMSVGFPYRSVEADVLNGEFASSLVRPVSYVSAALADWIGETTYRFIPVALASIVCGVVATHTVPFDLVSGAFLAVSLWLGCVMVLLCQLVIGLLATWMKSAAPAFWIWQKLFFVLGGLMIPLTFYPSWLAAVAKATPFAAMLFLPASVIFDASLARAAQTLAVQLMWIGVLVLITWFTTRRATAHAIEQGA
jgi:ABC-2 type transport system permease protein